MRRIVLRRTVLVLAALLLIGAATATAVRLTAAAALDDAVERFEREVGPLDVDAYRPDPVADDDNAALPVLHAIDLLETADGERSPMEVLGALAVQNHRSVDDWSTEEWRRARAAIARYPRVLESLHRAVGRPGSSYRLDYSRGYAMEIPNLLAVLRAGDLLFAEARLGWREGGEAGVEQAVGAVEALAALSRSLQAEAPLIFQLVGHRVERFQYRAIRDGLAGSTPGPAQLRRLQRCAVPRSRIDRLRRAVGGEAALLHEVRPAGRYGEALIEERPWHEGLAYRLVGDASVARALDYYVRVVEAFTERSYAAINERPDLLEPPADDRTELVVDLGRTVGILKATDSLSLLARSGLDLVSEAASNGAFPDRLPASGAAGEAGFTGQAPVVERAGPRSIVLSLPDAEALWRDLGSAPDRASEREPLFTWTLRCCADSRPDAGV